MIPVVLLNQFIIGIPLLKLYFWIWTIRIQLFDNYNYNKNKEIMMSSIYSIPSITRFIINMFINVLCTEIWFYTIHRILHNTK